MNRPAVLLVILAVALMLGMVPDTATAQTPAAAGEMKPDHGSGSDEATAEELWHDETSREGQRLAFDLDFLYRHRSFPKLEELDGSKHHFDRSEFEAEGKFEFWREKTWDVGVIGLYSSTSDNDGSERHGYDEIDLLDSYEAGGLLFWQLHSTHGDFMGRYLIGTGAGYHHWGRGYHAVWLYKVELEVGQCLSTSPEGEEPQVDGLVGGPEFNMKVGEHGSMMMKLDLTFGYKNVTSDLTVDVRILLRGNRDDANKVEGVSAGNVQHQGLEGGVTARALLWQTVEIRVELTTGLHGWWEVETRSQKASFETGPEGDWAIAGGVGLII